MVELSLGGISVQVQPSSGLDAATIRGAKRQFLERSTGPTDRDHIVALSGTLLGALKTLPAWPSTVSPGYDPLTGLHPGLSGAYPIGGEYFLETGRACGGGCQTVSAAYDLSGTAITGNIFSLPATIKRSISLIQRFEEPVKLVRTDILWATRDCKLGHLEHPNFVLLPGDRVLTNLDLVPTADGELCIFDRDGTTPDGLNIFQGLGQEAFEGHVPERCLLTYLRKTGDVLAMLLLDASGQSGLGVVHYSDHSDGSFAMVWVSPMGPSADQGVGSIEFATTLQLGATRNNELGLLLRLEAGQSITRITSLHFLDTKELVASFIRTYGITEDASLYPKSIGPDTYGKIEDYDPGKATFNNLRAVAGII